MRIYVAWVQENEYETEAFDIGVYSSKEKAREAILAWINDQSDEQWLSLEIYEKQEAPEYLFGIFGYELDKSPIE